jgi:predicted neutral ceramidase superfamily lipid hydrolase
MTQSCKYCTKTRANILLVFITIFLLNAVFRAYFDLSFDTTGDVMLLPSVVTLAFATAALIVKYTKFKFSLSNLPKN